MEAPPLAVYGFRPRRGNDIGEPSIATLSRPPSEEAAVFFKKRPKPESPVVHATDDDFEQLVEGGRGVSIVDFWAPWCGPCRLMEPILDEVALEYADDGVTVVKVNTEIARRSAERFGIRSIPTLIFFKDGEPLFEMVGMVPKPVLEREIGLLLPRRP
jgi:thioredoxin 1